MKEIYIFNCSSKASVYGIGTYLNEYIKCLQNLNIKVTVVFSVNSIGEIEISNEEEVRTIIIPYLNFQNIHFCNKMVGHLIRLYLQDSPDLFFHFNYTHQYSLLEIIKIYFPLSKKIFTVHYLNWSSQLNGDVNLFKNIIRNRNEDRKNDKYENLSSRYHEEKKMFDNLDAVVCLSEDTLELINNIYFVPNEKLYFIRNGSSFALNAKDDAKRDKIREEYNVEKEKIILFVGRIHPIKGIYQLLDSFNQVVKDFSNCRLVILGDGELDVVFTYCKDIWTKVTFTGVLNKEDVYKWYQIADLAVFPSFYEECSYVGIEMMAHGLPIIASDGYSVYNMFHESACIVPIGDINNLEGFIYGLKKSILELLESPQKLNELSDLSKKVFETTYHSNFMEDGYRDLFANL